MLIKDLVKKEYCLKMCTVKMQYSKRIAKYTKTWICQHNVFYINLDVITTCMIFILQIYVNIIWVNTILHWLYNDIITSSWHHWFNFEWVTNINRMGMLIVIFLALLFLIWLRFPLDKSITYVLRSRYGNLVVKELWKFENIYYSKMQVRLNISSGMFT